jgi:hypothetical protein
MKKLSILLAAMVLFIGISFASPVSALIQAQQKAADKKDAPKEATKKEDKKEVKKVPTKKKPDTKDQKATK